MKSLPDDLSELFTETQLYEKITFDMEHFPNLYLVLNKSVKMDCFCIECGKDSIFVSQESGLQEKSKWEQDLDYLRDRDMLKVTFLCSRDTQHKLVFFFVIQDFTIMKIGQLPSIADLSKNEIRKYQTLVGSEKYRELSKAIGLVSHGVGIGSFVYLRRVFETLIEEAHQKAKVNENWNEDEYLKMRMAERIGVMSDYLPNFLIEHKGMYSILSKGVHELSETECLEMFPAVKLGIELILDEKLEELEKQKKISSGSKAISSLIAKYK